MSNPDNSTWDERVQIELDELTVKLVRLHSFMTMRAFRALPSIQRTLLCDQSHAMAQYADLLGARLAADEQAQNSFDIEPIIDDLDQRLEKIEQFIGPID